MSSCEKWDEQPEASLRKSKQTGIQGRAKASGAVQAHGADGGSGADPSRLVFVLNSLENHDISEFAI